MYKVIKIKTKYEMIVDSKPTIRYMEINLNECRKEDVNEKKNEMICIPIANNSVPHDKSSHRISNSSIELINKIMHLYGEYTKKKKDEQERKKDEQELKKNRRSRS